MQLVRRMHVPRAALCLLLVLPATLSAGCMGGETVIEGVVRDRDTNEPIRGAEVEVSVGEGPSQTALTDEDGRYSIVVEPGTYDVEGSAPGYESAEATVVVEEGDTVERDFFLARSNEA